MTANRKQLGKQGELEACRRLRESGYAVKETNWRCRSGEIDIIAEQADRLIFIEVRTRSAASAGRFGSAAESVNLRKQKQVREIAQIYLRAARRTDAAIRFDVIAINMAADRETVESYRHYEAAF